VSTRLMFSIMPGVRYYSINIRYRFGNICIRALLGKELVVELALV
jgi:hypothetical protein